MVQKKILLIGERSLRSNEYAYADSFYDILIDLGYEVKSIDPTVTPWWLRGERCFALSGLEYQVFDRWLNLQVKSIAAEFKPDVSLVIKGNVLFPETLSLLKKNTSERLVLLYPDNPFMFSNGNSNARVVSGLPLYDVVLSWSQMLRPVFTSIGVAHSCYFPFGYDERFFSQNESGDQSVDLGFVGTADEERAQLFDQLVKQAPQISIGIWGNRWHEFYAAKPRLKNFYKGPAVYKQDMVNLLRRAKMTLNPVRLQNYTSHNMRSLEAAAAGVFQLATRTQEHQQVLFKENESIVLYGSVDELVDKVLRYKDSSKERAKIALAGRMVVQNYSLQVMLKKFFNNGCCFC